jgi:hypothetical protein
MVSTILLSKRPQRLIGDSLGSCSDSFQRCVLASHRLDAKVHQYSQNRIEVGLRAALEERVEMLV